MSQSTRSPTNIPPLMSLRLRSDITQVNSHRTIPPLTPAKDEIPNQPSHTQSGHDPQPPSPAAQFTTDGQYYTSPHIQPSQTGNKNFNNHSPPQTSAHVEISNLTIPVQSLTDCQVPPPVSATEVGANTQYYSYHPGHLSPTSNNNFKQHHNPFPTSVSGAQVGTEVQYYTFPSPSHPPQANNNNLPNQHQNPQNLTHDPFLYTSQNKVSRTNSRHLSIKFPTWFPRCNKT